MNSKTILLVEDDASDADLTKRALGKGHIVGALVTVNDGQEALDYLFGLGAYTGRDTSDMPALTLLDLKLPKVSGLDVLRRVRTEACTRRMPVVILTSSLEKDDLASSYDLGANSCIRKPVDFEQFVHSVSQLGLYWLGLNEEPPRVE